MVFQYKVVKQAGLYTHHHARSLRKVSHLLASMDKMQFKGTDVYVCNHIVTPFTIGFLLPKIVLPEKMLEEYGSDEIEMILLHEKMHIRLGHLLFYWVWEVLHALFWINPLFWCCQKFFKEDLEDICDKVTIQKSGWNGYEYGKLLIKSVKLLQNNPEASGMDEQFAFVGEKRFRQMKQRIIRVADFRTYRTGRLYGMILVFSLLLLSLLICILRNSYARYEDMDEVAVYNATGQKILVNDCEELREAVTYDDDFLYIDSELFMGILKKEQVSEQKMFVCFGGFYKIPGFGGGINCIYVDQDMLQEKTAWIPYQSRHTLDMWLLKVI